MKMMLIVFMVVAAVCFVAISRAHAAEMGEKAVTLTGMIVDNLCADGHKGDLSNFVKSHSKDCAMMPECMESGYSLYSGGKRYWFDKISSAKIADFLKKTDSKLEVIVVAEQKGDELKLISIKNE